jgi:hypothetical protein
MIKVIRITGLENTHAEPQMVDRLPPAAEVLRTVTTEEGVFCYMKGSNPPPVELVQEQPE